MQRLASLRTFRRDLAEARDFYVDFLGLHVEGSTWAGVARFHPEPDAVRSSSW